MAIRAPDRCFVEAAVAVLLPKEHGAYGQVLFPLMTALLIAGAEVPTILWSIAVTAAFFTHEPLVLLLGRRGTRARREHFATATRALVTTSVAATAAAILAVWFSPPDMRWWFAAPLLTAAITAPLIFCGREKTCVGEIAIALTFSAAALPAMIAAGTDVAAAMMVAGTYAIVFVSSLLAVRVVVLRVRGGGQPASERGTRLALWVLQIAALVALVWAFRRDTLPLGLLPAIAPTMVLTTTVASFPPPPRRLRLIGWSLVAATTITMTALVLTLSQT